MILTQSYSKILNLVSLVTLFFLAITIMYSDTFRLLSYDEADYVKASLEPFHKTWLSLNTTSLFQFITLGISKFGIVLSDNLKLIPESSDSFLLRHFHGVVPIYYLSIFSQITTSLDLARVYASLTLFFISYVSIIYYIKKTDQSSDKNIWTVIALVLFFTNAGVLESYSSFNFHIFLAVLLLPYCYYLNKTIVEASHINLFVLGFITALFWLTLETSLVISVATLIYLYWFNYEKVIKWHKRIFIVGMLVGFLLVNPGVVLSLDFIKSIAMYAYRIFAKGASEYSSNSTLPLLIASLKNYSLIFILIVFSHLAVMPIRSKINNQLNLKKIYLNHLSPEMFIGIVYLIFIIPFTLNATYLFPAILLLQLSVFRVTSSIKTNFPMSKFILFFCIFALLVSYMNFDKTHEITERFDHETRDFSLDVKAIKPYCSALGDGEAMMISDDANLLNLHLDEYCFDNLILDYGGKSLLVRIDKNYVAIDEVINKNRIIYMALSRARNYQSKLNQLNKKSVYIYKGNYFDLIQVSQ